MLNTSFRKYVRGPARRLGHARNCLAFAAAKDRETGAQRGTVTLFPRGGGWAARPEGMIATRTHYRSLALACAALGVRPAQLSFEGVRELKGAEFNGALTAFAQPLGETFGVRVRGARIDQTPGWYPGSAKGRWTLDLRLTLPRAGADFARRLEEVTAAALSILDPHDTYVASVTAHTGPAPGEWSFRVARKAAPILGVQVFAADLLEELELTLKQPALPFLLERVASSLVPPAF